MKKRILSEILVLLALVLTLVCVLSLGALATEDATATASATLNADETTPYGTIPAGTADLPVAVFSNGEFLDAYATLYDAFNAYKDNKTKNHIYYLRDNLVHNTEYRNLGQGGGTQIIDLNGKTVTLNANFIGAELKKGCRTSNVTVKNGTIVSNAYQVWRVGINNDGNSAYQMNATFQGVTFENVAGPIVDDRIVARKSMTSNVVFNDCTFNNLTSSLFDLGNEKLSAVHITVNGGAISTNSATSTTLITTGEDINENKTLTFGKGSDDNYLTIKTPNNDSGVVIHTLNDKVAFAKSPVSSTEDESVYVYAENTPYGAIPLDYFERAIIVFDAEGNICLATDKLSANGDTTTAFGYVSANAKNTDTKNYVIYLRRNVTKAKSDDDYGLGTIGGNHILDLGGHTLTQQTRTLFVMTAQNDLPFSYTVKNGNIKLSVDLVKFQAKTSGEGKVTNFIFENVTFESTSDKSLVRGTSGENDNVEYTVNMTFVDCTFYAKSNINLFDLDGNSGSGKTGVFDKAKVNVTVRGGEVIFPDDTFMLYNPADSEKYPHRILTFGTSNGKYTTVKLSAQTNVSTYTLTNENGKLLGLRKIDTEDEKNVYALTPFAVTNAHLNLTNDINFVYGAYLPAGYSDPVAIFTIGEHEVEAIHCIYDAEKGIYYFTLGAIGPHRMTDTVTIAVTANIGDSTETVIHDTLSAKSYIDTVREQYESDEALCALLDALLVYGATAQVYTNYNTENLVGEIKDLTDIPSDLPEATTGGVAHPDYKIAGYGLRLDGAFHLGVQIKAVSIEGITLGITKDGVETKLQLTEDMKSGDYYVIYCDSLIASELDKALTFTLYQNDMAIGNTLTVSAGAYLAAMQESSTNEALTNLVKALYAYGKSANAYILNSEEGAGV